MQTFHLSVKDKGRTVLPSALQKECGFAPGSDLVARTIGPGSFLVETPEAVLARVRGGLPDDALNEGGVEALDVWRAGSDAERRSRLEEASYSSERTSRQRGNALLDELGL